MPKNKRKQVLWISLGARCRRFESCRPDHAKRTTLMGGSLCVFQSAVTNMRQLASKARHLLWAKPSCAANGRPSRTVLVQRSIKSRISVSPKILSGTANRRRSRRCRRFESCRPDHTKRTTLMAGSLCVFHATSSGNKEAAPSPAHTGHRIFSLSSALVSFDCIFSALRKKLPKRSDKYGRKRTC